MPLKSESSVTTFSSNQTKCISLKGVPLTQIKSHQYDENAYSDRPLDYQEPPATKQNRPMNPLSSAKKAAVFIYRENEELGKPPKLSTFAENHCEPDKSENDSLSSGPSNQGERQQKVF